MPQRVGRGLGPAVRARLVVAVGDVALDRMHAQRECVRDRAIRVPLGQQPKHLDLPWREAIGRRSLDAVLGDEPEHGDTDNQEDHGDWRRE